MKRINTTVVAGALFFLSFSTHATPILDQAFDTIGDTSFNGGDSSLTWQQGVTAGQSGTLARVEIFFNDNNLSQGIDFFVNLGSPWQNDTNDFSTTLSLVAGWNSVDVLGAGISLLAGDEFVFGLRGLGTDFNPSFKGNSTDSYSGGATFLDGTEFLRGEYDINFRTYVDVTESVPAPATLALFGLGLAGLGWSRRKRA